MSRLVEYFDNESKNYLNKSRSGLWKKLRNIERNSLARLIPVSPNSEAQVLDLGSGSGFYIDLLRKKGYNNITCVDVSHKMLQHIQDTQCIKIHAAAESFKSGRKYDLIFCAGVLEFSSQPELILKTISSQLKPNGCVVLLFPLNSFWGKLYQKFHRKNGLSIKLFTENELQNQLKNFHLKTTTKKNNYNFSLAISAKFE